MCAATHRRFSILAGVLLTKLIAAPVGAQWLDPSLHTVRDTLAHGQRAIPADMDGDGAPDLISAYSLSDQVVLEVNNLDGGGDPWQLVPVGSDVVAMFAMPANLDGDGDLDIAAVGLFDRDTGFNTEGLVVWYERGPGGITDWSTRIIDETVVHPRYLDVGDMDDDGDTDLLVTSSDEYAGGGGFGNVILFYENTGPLLPPDPGLGWIRWTIASGLSNPESARLIDIDGDPFPEVVVAEWGGDRLFWLDSGGSPQQHNWTQRQLDDALSLPSSARPYDMDADGDQDVLVAFDGAGIVQWYEHPGPLGDPVADAWTEHWIGNLSGATDLVRADFNNDGRLDIAAGGFTSGVLAFFENTGDGMYTEHLLVYPSFTSVEAADLDGDGDLDAVSSSYDGNSMDWWQNLHPGGGPIFADGFESGDTQNWFPASP
ncbi:MAG: VCBS repeat-containing protein [Thermoanaerobaculia bacterium]|nr:VCBS repeat-containing protein [Thermoanaerobaculia bacterium]